MIDGATIVKRWLAGPLPANPNWSDHIPGGKRADLAAEIDIVIARLTARLAEATREQMFPIITGGFPKQTKPHLNQIPWTIAEKAYSIYSAQYGRYQSLERLAERGGFHPEEMDMFYPSWREEADEIFCLRAKLAEMTRERDSAHDFIRHIEAALEGQLPVGYTTENATAVGAAFRSVTERETLRAKLAEVERERDEALAAMSVDTANVALHSAALRTERDTLRAALRQCGKALAYTQTTATDSMIRSEILETLALPAVRAVMETG